MRCCRFRAYAFAHSEAREFKQFVTQRFAIKEQCVDIFLLYRILPFRVFKSRGHVEHCVCVKLILNDAKFAADSLKLLLCEDSWCALYFEHKLIHINCNEGTEFVDRSLSISVSGWDIYNRGVQAFYCVKEYLNFVVSATWAVKQSEEQQRVLCDNVRVYFAKPSSSRCNENWRGEQLSKGAIRILEISPCFSLVRLFQLFHRNIYSISSCRFVKSLFEGSDHRPCERELQFEQFGKVSFLLHFFNIWSRLVHLVISWRAYSHLKIKIK